VVGVFAEAYGTCNPDDVFELTLPQFFVYFERAQRILQTRAEAAAVAMLGGMTGTAPVRSSEAGNAELGRAVREVSEQNQNGQAGLADVFGVIRRGRTDR
jgi:hypothetical protein